jgi:uncharacterized RDD family membrane protein YckC
MKCPKCDYLGFETGDRCRNCGYDFSLLASARTESEDLSLTLPARDDVPADDLWIEPSHSSPAGFTTTPEVVARVGSFPLFAPAGDDEPLIKTPSEPRPPLSVRRTPELVRSRHMPPPPPLTDSALSLEFADEQSADVAARADAISTDDQHAIELDSRTPDHLPTTTAVASLGSRTRAAVIDHAILFGIDIIVFYSTLRMAALTTDEWRVLPILPFLAFLLLLKVGYFSAFTALGGQTIGKMAAGIRVVADDHLRMDPSRAIRRTLTGVVSLASLGLGLIPALVSPDRRALHDRVAHTHVVELPSA